MLNPLPLLRYALRPFILFINYLRRSSLSTVAMIGAVLLGLGAMALLFFEANPLGENDANFNDSLDADQTGVKFYLGQRGFELIDISIIPYSCFSWETSTMLTSLHALSRRPGSLAHVEI